MNVNHALSLNVSSASVPPTLHMTQGDSNSRSIVAALFSGASPFNIPSGSSVMVRFRKPDGTGGLYDATESGAHVVFAGNTVTAPVAAQMISVPGVVVAQIELYSAATEESPAYRLASFCFFVDVEKSAYPDDTIISSDYYNILSESIQQALQYSQISQSSAKDAEAWAVGQRGGVDVPSTDPAYNNNAKYWSQNAETINLATSRVTGTLPLSKGGTGATTAAAARTKLGLGTLATKSAVGLDGSDVTGTLPVSKGGTGQTTIAGILSALGISDYIESSGTTAKTGITWTWRKYASGVAMCWGTCNQITTDVTTAWGGVYVPGSSGNAGPFDLPFDFTASRCWAAPATWVGDYWLCTWWTPDPTKQTPGYQPVRGSSKTGMTYSIALFVIGTWK